VAGNPALIQARILAEKSRLSSLEEERKPRPVANLLDSLYRFTSSGLTYTGLGSVFGYKGFSVFGYRGYSVFGYRDYFKDTPPEGPAVNFLFPWVSPTLEREFFIVNLLVRIHFIIVVIRWTGLAPWEFEFPFPGSLFYLPISPTLFTASPPPE